MKKSNQDNDEIDKVKSNYYLFYQWAVVDEHDEHDALQYTIIRVRIVKNEFGGSATQQ